MTEEGRGVRDSPTKDKKNKINSYNVSSSLFIHFNNKIIEQKVERDLEVNNVNSKFNAFLEKCEIIAHGTELKAVPLNYVKNIPLQTG